MLNKYVLGLANILKSLLGVYKAKDIAGFCDCERTFDLVVLC